MDKFLEIENHELKKNSFRNNEVITLTWCDAAENHIGMENIGEKSINGFNLKDLQFAKEKFEDKGFKSRLIKLNDYYDLDEIPEGKEPENAFILVVENGVICLLNDENPDEKDDNTIMDNFYKELTSFEWDRKYYDTRRKKVLNKHARANVCFSEESQKADFENKKGSIIAFKDLKMTNLIRDKLPEFIGENAKNLKCEGNFYFNKSKCGIGFHGDAERKKVIGLRIGEMILKFSWFYNCKPIGKPFNLELNDGDLYIMCEKATGNDWKKKSKVTLRHAAGCDKYTKL